MFIESEHPRRADGKWTDAGDAIRRAASDTPDFKQAKTIQEAEEWAKKNIAKNVSYRVGDDHLEGINRMNKEVHDLLNEFKGNSYGNREQLTELTVRVFNKGKEIGMGGFAGHTGEMILNQSQLRASTFDKLVSDKGITAVMNRGKEIEGLVSHEFAHTIWQKVKYKDGFTDKALGFDTEINKMYKEYKKTISVDRSQQIGFYSTFNVDEFYAEHFASFRNGKQTPMAKKVWELTKKYFK